MALLDLVHVTAGYGRRDVVHDVSLAVSAGEVVALIGPNGAGKTTLLRAAAGILAPRTGSIRVDGKDLSTLSAREAALLVSGVPQDDATDFAFTAREVAAMGRSSRLSPFRTEGAEDRSAVDAALAAVGLLGLADRSVTTLSGGERRRASVARCLAQDAKVLLLDEPTAHLDLGHETRLLAALVALAKARGKAVVAAVHDLNLAAMHADRVVLLADGRVVADGTPRDVLVPDRLAAAFGARVHVLSHPDTQAPVIVPRGGGRG